MAETVISHRETFETIIAQLIQMLGATDKNKQELYELISKMFSELDDSERHMLLWKLGIYNEYKWIWLKNDILDFLNLSVSLNRSGRKEITELGKMPLQMESPENMSRWQKLKQLGNIFG